jgi:hypothetical protein
MLCPVQLHAALATSVSGFYYTGESTSGTLLGQGADTPTVANSGQQDAAWVVTYATTNGGASADTANEGTSYVINTTNTTYSSQYPSPPWVPNTSTAQWITAPGAVWTNGSSATNNTPNAGGDGLYAYGANSSPLPYNNANAAEYVYTTTFTITGTGTGAITGFTLNLSLAADNSFSIFVNPASTRTVLNPATAAYVSAASAYTATSAVALTSGFVVGVNTISIEVENAGKAGTSQINYSGLLVYGAGMTGVLPEVGTWVPMVGAVLVYGLLFMARRRLGRGPAFQNPLA